MIQVYLLLLLGLVLLFIGGKYLVESSVAIARRFRIPTMIIGLTVVAFGTSAPELLVSIQAAIRGSPEISLGNVVGSNISNILLVAAIDLAGMSVAFPVGVGLALVIGVVQNYIKNPAGNPVLIFSGVGAIVLAMVMAALAYKKLNGESGSSTKGLILSIAAGVLMGSFYGFVIDAIAPGFFASTEGSMVLEAGKATPPVFPKTSAVMTQTRSDVVSTFIKLSKRPSFSSVNAKSIFILPKGSS